MIRAVRDLADPSCCMIRTVIYGSHRIIHSFIDEQHLVQAKVFVKQPKGSSHKGWLSNYRWKSFAFPSQLYAEWVRT